MPGNALVLGQAADERIVAPDVLEGLGLPVRLYAKAPQPETVDCGMPGSLPRCIDRVAMQEHLDFVEPSAQGVVLSIEFAIQPTSGNSRERREIGGNSLLQSQVPAAGVGGVEFTDVGKFGVERCNDCRSFFLCKRKRTCIGKDDPFMVEAQV